MSAFDNGLEQKKKIRAGKQLPLVQDGLKIGQRRVRMGTPEENAQHLATTEKRARAKAAMDAAKAKASATPVRVKQNKIRPLGQPKPPTKGVFMRTLTSPNGVRKQSAGVGRI